jgi:hypothetical protein
MKDMAAKYILLFAMSATRGLEVMLSADGADEREPDVGVGEGAEFKEGMGMGGPSCADPKI